MTDDRNNDDSPEPMSNMEVEQFAHYLMVDTIAFINENALGVELEAAINFLSMFVGHLVYKALTNRPEDIEDPSDQELEDYSFNSYQNMRENIQNAVSNGFKGAMETFSGRSADYYCKVSPVPAPVNKRPI